MPCSKRMKSCRSGCLHRQLVEDYYAARDAQQDQAEAEGVGYVQETQDFYDQHPKLTFKFWLYGQRQSQLERRL